MSAAAQAMRSLGLVIAATLLDPATASAQTVNGQELWAAKPTIDELPWPEPAPSGYVEYRCKVTLAGLLEDCSLVVAKPNEANAATDGLLSKLRMSAEGRRVFASDGTSDVIFQWYWGGKDPNKRPSELAISVPWPMPALPDDSHERD